MLGVSAPVIPPLQAPSSSSFLVKLGDVGRQRSKKSPISMLFASVWWF